MISRETVFFIARLCLCACVLTASLGVRAEYRLGRLTAAEGLEHHNYNAFVSSDSRGFSWIGSMKGIYRFDGRLLQHYPLDLTGEWSTNVQSRCFEAADGTLYFSTADAIYRYQPATDAMTRLRIPGMPKLDGAHLFHLDSARRHLWYRHGAYLYRYDLASGGPVGKPTASRAVRLLPLQTAGDETWLLGSYWKVGTGIELCRVGPEGGACTPVVAPALADARISEAIQTDARSVWLVGSNGLYHFDPLTRRAERMPPPPGLTSYEVYAGVRCDPQHLLLTIKTEGLWYFNLSERRFTRRYRGDQEQGKWQTDQPVVLTKTRDGRLWAMHVGRGLDYTKTAGTLPVTITHRTTIGERVVAACPTADDRLWSLTNAGRVFSTCAEGLVREQQQLGTATALRNWAITVDPTGTLWAAVDSRLYARPATEDRFTLRHQFTGSEGSIQAIRWSATGNYVLTSRGIYSLSTEAGAIPKMVRAANVDSRYDNLCLLGDSVVLLGYDWRSVELLTKTADKLMPRCTVHPKVSVYAVLPLDVEKDIWLLGTGRGAVTVQLDTTATCWRQLAVAHPRRRFQALARDARGVIWTVSDRQVGCMRDGQWRFFDTELELDPGVFGAALGTFADGRQLWVGTKTGLAYLQTTDSLFASGKARAYLRRLWINELPATDPSPEGTDTFSLDYRKNNLHLEFGTVGTYGQAAPDYEYRLGGRQAGWSRLTGNNQLVFPRLPPGAHTLTVRSVDAQNRRGPPISKTFIIRPPFWQTGWFRLLLPLAVTLAVLIAMRWNYRRKLRRERAALHEQRLLYAERDRIARELHDELGGELSSLIFLGEDLQHTADRRTAARMVDLSRHASEYLRDIIWALDTEHSSPAELADRIGDYGVWYLEPHGIRFRYEQPSARPPYRLSSGQKRGLWLVYKELLHNVVKHAAASEVRVVVVLENDALRLQLSDNGCGFDPEGRRGTGYGLNNMRQRMADLGGTLQCTSSPGTGTQYRLSMPLPGPP